MAATPSQRSVRVVVPGVVIAMVGATLFVAGPSVADPGKTIEQVREELQALEVRAESALEMHSEAQARLQRISGETQQAQKQVNRAKKDVETSRAVIGAIAAQAYQTGGMDAQLQLLLAQDPGEFLAQAAALDRVAANQATAMRRASTANLRYAQATAALEAKQAEQEATVEETAQRRDEINSAVQDTEDYLAQLEEEERQRLAAIAAAEAAAAAAAAARAAAAAEDAASGSGTADTPTPPADPAGANDAAGGGAAGSGAGANDAAGGGAAGSGAGANDAGGGGAAGSGAATNQAGGGGASGSESYSARAAIAVRAALAQVGEPYTYNARPPDTWDCSKLTAWAWGQAGVSLTAYSYAQANEVRRVSVDDMQPGDILFYFRGAHHVAMYIGGGQIVEASSPSTGVRVTSVWNGWSSSHFSFVGRPI